MPTKTHAQYQENIFREVLVQSMVKTSPSLFLNGVSGKSQNVVRIMDNVIAGRLTTSRARSPKMSKGGAQLSASRNKCVTDRWRDCRAVAYAFVYHACVAAARR
jgi:hypothetical protein